MTTGEGQTKYPDVNECTVMRSLVLVQMPNESLFSQLHGDVERDRSTQDVSLTGDRE
jgi:hypothetical protein